MSSEPQRNRLPFEPGKSPKKSAKKETPASKKSEKPAPKSADAKADAKKKATASTRKPSVAKEQTAIPEAVSKRMVARMGLFSGTPTLLGVLSLVGSYFVVTREWFPLPHVAVLLVSMGFFGLGVLGLSYGVFSASWDEEIEGSKVGWTEFKTNLGRTIDTWRSRGQKN